MNREALLLVDLQNDFCAGGALAVPDGDAVIEVANRVMDHFDLVVATQDYHPREHGSFAANHPGKRVHERAQLAGVDQVLWPVHCVQGTRGADFHPRLRRERIARVFTKGTDPRVDSYSAFFDNARRRATGLAEYLHAEGVEDVYLMGLATDYCVRWTTLDGLELGFRMFIVEDGCRGVNIQPDDSVRALRELRDHGARITASTALGKRPRTPVHRPVSG